MKDTGCCVKDKKPREAKKILLTLIFGTIFGFLIGVSFPALSLTDLNIKESLNVDSTTETSDLSANQNVMDPTKIWASSNPRGAERLPPKIVVSESDFFLRQLCGDPSEDLTSRPKYLATFTVGYNQKNNVNAAIKKFSDNFTILLFHYDGQTTEWDEFEWSKRAIHVSAPKQKIFLLQFSDNFTILLFHCDGQTTEWDEFEWSKRAIHVSAPKQTKWWYAKRFLHPDIVAPYEYIFIWDEDLGVENFNAEEYIKLVKKHGLEISQPALEPVEGYWIAWEMTKRKSDREVHKETEEKPGWCTDPHLPPCAAFVEIMAPVFSRDSWRCVWHMIQNDLIHGWGLDLALQRCVVPAHEKIGVVDAQPVFHQRMTTLGDEGIPENGKSNWQAVNDRCNKEWVMFRTRLGNAEKVYYKSIGIQPSDSTAH